MTIFATRSILYVWRVWPYTGQNSSDNVILSGPHISNSQENLLLVGFSIYVQNILEPIKKSSKVEQDEKTWTSTLTIFLSAGVKIQVWKRDWTLECVPTQFWAFPNIYWFPKIFKSYFVRQNMRYIECRNFLY